VGNFDPCGEKTRVPHFSRSLREVGVPPASPCGRASAEELECKTKRVGNLAEFFAASPLRGSAMKVRRFKAHPKKISL
jgi:hypothetical protein